MEENQERGGKIPKFEETPVADFVMGIFLIALCSFVMYVSWTWPRFGVSASAPGLFPFLIAASLLVMAVFLLFRSIQEKGHLNLVARVKESWAGKDTRPTLLVLSLVLVYIIGLLNRLPFEIATLIYIVASLLILWHRKLWLVLAIAGGTVAFYSISFRYFFKILLPGSGL